jgi:hypothetical protein
MYKNTSKVLDSNYVIFHIEVPIIICMSKLLKVIQGCGVCPRCFFLGVMCLFIDPSPIINCAHAIDSPKIKDFVNHFLWSSYIGYKGRFFFGKV